MTRPSGTEPPLVPPMAEPAGPRRAVRWLGLLILVLPVLWLRFSGADAEVPVQAELQGVLAGRLLRVATLEEDELPPGAREMLLQEAESMLDEGLDHRPGDPELLAWRAVAARVARGGDAARRVLAAPAEPSRLLQVLDSLYGGPEPLPADAAEVIRQGLGGFYRYQALRDLDPEAQGTLQDQARRAEGDLRTLALLTALVAGAGALGTLALLFLPLWIRRVRRTGTSLSTAWDPYGAVAAVVAFQYLAFLVIVPLSAVLRGAGVPPVPGVVVMQGVLYVLALALLVRALPRLAPESPGPAPTLGLAPFRAGAAALGVVGFWMAVPLVLLASLVTSALLGQSPFSSNPALRLLLEASPADLAFLAVLVALAGPFFEEVLFRGVLFAGLRRSLGPLLAGAASAVAFGLVHGDAQALLVLSTLGGLFAFLYERTGSLWPGVVAHGLWNGTTMLIVTVILAGD